MLVRRMKEVTEKTTAVYGGRAEIEMISEVDVYKRQASSIGPYMQNSFDAVLLAPQHEEQTYNSCNGILHMCKNQSNLMLEDIAKTCVDLVEVFCF